MNDNKAIIEGLNTVMNGINTIITALNSGGAEATNSDEKTPIAAPTGRATRRSAAPKDVPAEKTGDETFTRAELDAMPYNKFKTLAANLGVKCTGTRDDIMNRIAALGVISDADSAPTAEPEDTAPKKTAKKPGKKTPAEPEPEPEKPSKSDKPVSGKRGLVKKAVEPTTDEFDQQAEEIAGDTPVEDIISALSDVGVKATKRDYKAKLAQALRDGLLTADDDDEDADETDDDDTTSDDGGDEGEEEVGADSYFPQYDPEGFNNPDTMTDARSEAVIAAMDEVLTDYSEGTLTDDDIENALTDGLASQAELDLLGDDPSTDDKLMLYMELKKRLIDDDGETHEPGDAYELNKEDFCCGHPLKFSRKTNKFICEMCGTEYEAGEE